MYLDYYDLKEKPFSLSPDPSYLYYSQSHKEALAQMIYTATQDPGFMVLIGEVGTGKTVLINSLINQFPETYHFAKIYHSALSPKGLIQNICKEFNLDYVNKTMTQLVLKIQDFLKWNYNSGGRSVLILDEAQNLGTETLEEIRLLSNFETAHKKIMQIYLIGQPELEEKLLNTNLRQLRERVSLKFILKRLNLEETKLYINHRLKVAGLSGKRDLFIEEAIEKVYEISKGTPRRINILCDNALLLGYSEFSNKIDAAIIRRASYCCEMGLSAEVNLTDTTTPQPDKNLQGLKPNREVDSKEASTSKATQQGVIKTQSIEKSSGDDVIDYKKIENIMRKIVKKHRIFFVRKPGVIKIILSVLLTILILVFSFYLAILLSVEFGILN